MKKTRKPSVARFLIGLTAMLLSLPVSMAQDTTIVVGAIAGSGGASGLGGALYSIPIQAPEGLGGMKPSVSIAYNSQGSNGLLGWCWDLQGVSSITRIGTTQYHDGNMSGVDFDDDRFALDGQRLISIEGNYGEHRTEYRMETDGMARIVSYTCDTTIGPAYFKVWLPNGNIAYYGNTWSSRIGLKQRNEVCVWLLNRLEDRNGNYMDYHYIRGDTNYDLYSISYGGNSLQNIPCCYTMRFLYSQRDDTESAFIGDNTLNSKRRLDTIKMMHGQTELYKYWFDYYDPNFSTGYYYTRLRQVNYDCGGQRYNPTVIQWGENDYGSYGSAQSRPIGVIGGLPSEFSDRIKFTGDLNGDGYTDFIILHIEIPSFEKSAIIYINKGDAIGWPIFSRLESTIELDEDIDWIYTADINGDGLDDIIQSSRKRTLIGKDRLNLSAYLSSVASDGTYSFSRASQSFGEFRIKKKYTECILLGDFLGEGKQSILLQECEENKDTPRLFYITCSGNSLSAQQLPSDMVLDADKMFACDFNCDGVSEIYFMNKDTSSTGLLRMRHSNSGYSYQTVNNNMLSPWHQVFPGDFNGDGRPDLFSYVEDGNGNGSWHLNYFKETKLKWPAIHFSEQTIGIGNPGTHGYSLKYLNEADYKFITVGDFNGDGKADVAVRTGDNQMKFLYGPVREVLGQGQFASSQTVSLSDIGMNGASNQTFCTGNFLGHENICMFSKTTLHALNPFSNRYSVEHVTDGMGNRTVFEYDYLMPEPLGLNDTTFYTKSMQTPAERAENMFTVALPMKGLARMTTYNIHCQDIISVMSYRYANALVHKRGRGFLGFKWVLTESRLSSSKQQTVERIFETMFAVPSLALKTERVRDGDGSVVSSTVSDNVVLRRCSPSWAVQKIFVPVVRRQKCINYDIDHPNNVLKATVTEYGYNDTTFKAGHLGEVSAYRLLKLTDIRQGVDSSGSVNTASACEFQTLTHTEYHTETSSDLQDWIVNRPRSVRSVARRLGGYSDIVSLTVYRYADGQDGGPFQPSRVVTYPGGTEDPNDPLATFDSTSYFPNGRVWQKVSGDLASALPLRIHKYSYSPDGRFVVSENNAADQTTSYSYDPDYGFLLSETDCNGLQTRYKASPIGAWSATYPPNGGFIMKVTRWINPYDSLAPNGAFYYHRTYHLDKHVETTYFDASGKKLRTISPGMHSEPIAINYSYDNKGLLSWESMPYFYGVETAYYWTHYSYDSHNRLFFTEHPDGFNEAVTYNGFTTTHVNYAEPYNPKYTSTTVNAAGWTVKSTDEEGNEVQYDHYADGKPKTVRIGTDNSTAVSFGYDDAGNRVAISDPDYGTVRSVYDAYGQLTETENPSGEATSYRYDVLGRMVKRYEYNRFSSSIDSTVWHYSNRLGHKGLLDSVVFSGGGQAVGYTYDSLKRVSTVSERRGSSVYNTYYTYDLLSRVRTVTYPSGFVTHRYYTATSHLEALYNETNNTPLWVTESKNALGQVTRYHTGDSTITARAYDPSTGRLTGIVSWKGNDTIQNLSYVFDKNANLASRKDNLRNMEERFTYDRLDRLTGIIEGIDTTGVFTYDGYGRMTMKRLHDAPVFDNTAYGADGRPHALAQAQMYSILPHQRIRYTSFDKIHSIQQTDDMLLLDRSLRYDYGYDHRRIRMTDALSIDTVVKEYVGSCEFVRQNGAPVSERTFLGGPLGVFAVLDSHVLPVGKALYYVHPDHLGSWTTVTDRVGAVVQDVRFDPWGTPYYSDSTHLVQATSLLFERGFTGHEHMTGFGLVNMNGRVYDPVTSTFLSADNYVQDPSYTQNFNRYAYCLNNPLKYTDPDGDFFWIIPNIGWSKEGGLSLGLTFAVGLPGLWSAQASVGYSISSQTIYGSAGVTCAGVTGYVSAGYSTKNGQISASLGVTAGLSPYSGVPVSTNFFTVGASYDYTYSKTLGGNFSFTGQLSAWSYNSSIKEWHFNPSISAMVLPEHTTNLVRGQGFRSNDYVLRRFVANNQHQEALQYFDIEGKYHPQKAKGAEYVEGTNYYGSTNPKTGDISFGDLAFDSYDNLRGIYEKELYSSNKVHRGENLETFEEEGLESMLYFPEEARGFLHAGYKNNLYPNSTIDFFGQANAYWNSVNGIPIRSPRFYDFIFKIPRKW